MTKLTIKNKESSLKNRIEDVQLQGYVDHRDDLHVYLVSGIKLLGKVEDFDERVILLRQNPEIEADMVYKHAISTIAIARSRDEFRPSPRTFSKLGIAQG